MHLGVGSINGHIPTLRVKQNKGYTTGGISNNMADIARERMQNDYQHQTDISKLANEKYNDLMDGQTSLLGLRSDAAAKGLRPGDPGYRTFMKIQRGLRQQISAVQGAARNPKLAARMGVDVKDPVAVQMKIAKLKAELARWQNWPMHPDLVALTHEGEFGPDLPGSELPMKSSAPGYEKSPEQLDMTL